MPFQEPRDSTWIRYEFALLLKSFCFTSASNKKATRMYVLAGVAVYEAGVQAWTLKRQYQSIRPGEYIPMFRINDTLRHQYVGPYCPNEDIPGWRWIPYQFLPLNTPPFPEYPSGHSSFSSAVMSVMALFTGSDTLPKPLSYPYKV